MGFASQAKKHDGVIMDDDKGFKDSNFSASSDDEISSVASFDSSDDDEINNNNSSASLSSSPNSPFSYSNKSSPSGDSPAGAGDSLNDMSTLLQQLPFKRGLSRHFEGKSQSFTCLSNVRCLEDLAKPENPYKKKLKSCKSYVGLYGESQRSSSNQQMSGIIPKSASSRLISKKTSRGSCSAHINSAAKRNNSRCL